MQSRLVQVDPEQVVRRWLSIHGVHNFSPQDLQTAVAFLQQYHDQFPLADLVERTFALANVNDAIEFGLSNRPIRIAVRPH